MYSLDKKKRWQLPKYIAENIDKLQVCNLPMKIRYTMSIYNQDPHLNLRISSASYASGRDSNLAQYGVLSEHAPEQWVSCRRRMPPA